MAKIPVQKNSHLTPGEIAERSNRSISTLPAQQSGRLKHAAEKTNINILFISSDPSGIKDVKSQLSQSAGMAYRVEHRPDFFGSADLLAKGHTHIDVILLDLEMLGATHSREIFHRMVKMAHGIPIIVFTDRADHEMALLAMEGGTLAPLGNIDVSQTVSEISAALAHAKMNYSILRAPMREIPDSAP